MKRLKTLKYLNKTGAALTEDFWQWREGPKVFLESVTSYAGESIKKSKFLSLTKERKTKGKIIIEGNKILLLCNQKEYKDAMNELKTILAFIGRGTQKSTEKAPEPISPKAATKKAKKEAEEVDA